MEKCLERLKFLLSENGIKYETQHHQEVYTTQEVAAELKEKGRHVAKVFIALADGKVTMLVLPAFGRVDFDRAKELLGAKFVRRAQEDEFKHVFPDCEVGAMPPFGNLYNVPVYLDRSLASMPYLVFQAGSHRDSMKIAMSDYLRAASPVVGDFIQRAEPAGAVAQ